MYLRTVKAKGADGVEFEYIRLVEAYWENGHSKQRVVANLGRKDVLAPHLESLIECLVKNIHGRARGPEVCRARP